MPYIVCYCQGCKYNIDEPVEGNCKHKKPNLTIRRDHRGYDCESFHPKDSKPKTKGGKK